MKEKERLYSLDCLRGLDMFLLTVITPVVCAADRSWGLPPGVMKHFQHVWNVFSLHDVIMPCFIFMCGAAIPFAMGGRLRDGRPTAEFWRHLVSRFLLLYFLGSVVQCNLLSFDPMEIHVFYNTLQVIGVAYVFTSLMMFVPSRSVRIATIPVLLAVMGVVTHLAGHGDYTETGNFVYRFDRIVWGLFLPEGQHSLKPNGYYCYLLPQLAAFALTQLGYECTLVLRSGRNAWRKAGILGVVGLILLCAGWTVSVWVPVIKHIYSASFSLLVAGWSVVALAVLYVVTDIWKFRRGLRTIIVFGQHSLTAYLLWNLFGHGFVKAAERLTVGVPHLFGERALPFAGGLVAAAMLVAVMYVWDGFRRHRREKKEMKGGQA